MSAGLSDDEIEERFFLLGRMEILSVLNDLIHRRESVTVSFNGGRDFFLTTLLEARPEALVFDLGGDVRANQRLPESQSCVFVARPNGIRVQFAGGQARLFSWGGSDAFWVPLPERVVRLQRRESFRILMPVVKAPIVSLYSGDGGSVGKWPLHDLSVGGLGATVIGPPRLELGEAIVRLSFMLPEHGWIDCSGTVRHATLRADNQGGPRYRVGVGFSGLARPMEVAIQRYVIAIEHERRRLVTE